MILDMIFGILILIGIFILNMQVERLWIEIGKLRMELQYNNPKQRKMK